MLKTWSVIGYFGMVGGLFALAAMQSLFSPFWPVISAQAVAVLLLIWARITFGRRSFHAVASPTEGGLVTDGPYRVIRHPIYASVCLFAVAGAAAHWSWQAAVGIGLILIGAAARIHCEETLVTARYPEYTGYAARTWRMIPYLY